MKRSIPLLVFTLAVCGRCNIGEYHRYRIPALDLQVECAMYENDRKNLSMCKDGKTYLNVQNVIDDGPTGDCL